MKRQWQPTACMMPTVPKKGDGANDQWWFYEIDDQGLNQNRDAADLDAAAAKDDAALGN